MSIVAPIPTTVRVIPNSKFDTFLDLPNKGPIYIQNSEESRIALFSYAEGIFYYFYIFI